MTAEALRRLVREIADFAFASVCAGCGATGTALCADCERGSLRGCSALHPGRAGAAAGRARVRGRRGGRAARGQGGRPDLPDPGAASRARRGRRRSARAVARTAGGRAIDVVVPVPTSRAAFRRRGFRVPDLLARGTGIPVRRALAYARRIEDQRGLTRRAAPPQSRRRPDRDPRGRGASRAHRGRRHHDGRDLRGGGKSAARGRLRGDRRGGRRGDPTARRSRRSTARSTSSERTRTTRR